MKEKINGLRGFCPFHEIYKRWMAKRGLKELSEEQKRKYCNVSHPLVRLHPETQKKALYLNKLYLEYIKGLSNEESENILNYLYDFVTQPKFVYKHRWSDGDLVIWDNAALMHKAIKAGEDSIKSMLRCTVKGDIPF